MITSPIPDVDSLGVLVGIGVSAHWVNLSHKTYIQGNSITATGTETQELFFFAAISIAGGNEYGNISTNMSGSMVNNNMIYGDWENGIRLDPGAEGCEVLDNEFDLSDSIEHHLYFNKGTEYNIAEFYNLDCSQLNITDLGLNNQVKDKDGDVC
jgi:hypothetical protein